MLVWVWRFILTESGTIGQFACHTGKCVNALEQRTTVVPANFIGYRISSFKFPLGLIVSVSFSTQYCQFHLWYRTGYRTTNVKPPFFNKPPPFSGEKNYQVPFSLLSSPFPLPRLFLRWQTENFLIIERRSRFVTLPWWQHFWMTTKSKFALFQTSSILFIFI